MTGARLAKIWKCTIGDRAALAASGRVIRRRPATGGERKRAGLGRDHDAQAVVVKTCSGGFTVVTPDRGMGEYSLIGNALANDWNRPRAEVMAAIATVLNADDATLGDLATALITARTLCRKGDCSKCACGFAPLFAAPVTASAQVAEATGDAKAVLAKNPEVNDAVRSVSAKIRLVVEMRGKMKGAV